MTDIRTVSLLDILPPSLRNDPGIKSIAAAFDPEYRDISASMDQLLFYANLENLPEALVDLLAFQKHVDFYDPTLPLYKKVELVKYADATHRRKGTPWAVDQVASAAFDDSVVSEWFEYGGLPYRFKVTTTDRMTDPERYDGIIRAINSVKNKRSRLETITIRRDNIANHYIGGVVSTLRIRTIKPAI